jgi:hypothetical protein
MASENIKFKSYTDKDGLISYMKIIRDDNVYQIFYEGRRYQIKVTPELDYDFYVENCDLIFEKIKKFL